MSEILQAWRAGRGFPNTLVIDGHTHVHDWPHGANFDSVEEAARESVAEMDAHGVDAACVMSGGYMAPGTDYRRGNDALLRLVALAPDRLIGFAHVNPNDGAERIVAELERCWDGGLRCIKLLNSYQHHYPGDGPALMELYRFAAERGMLVFNHWWSPEEMGRIAPQFPGVDFMFAHYSFVQDDVLRDLPNVYANIWTLDSLGFLERGVRNVGPEKFTFGSDGFMNVLSVGIGLVVYADIPDEQKRMILGGTMARLLDKVGALPERLSPER